MSTSNEIDNKIKEINEQLKPLYQRLNNGDTSVQEQIQTLEAKRTTYETISRNLYNVEQQAKGFTTYLTQDMPSVTEQAVKNIGTSIFSFTKWIVYGLIAIAIIYIIHTYNEIK